MRYFLLFLPAALFAQLSDEYNPPRAQCCLAMTAQRFAEQLQDWNQLGRYHADNERLKAQPPPNPAASCSWAIRLPMAGSSPIRFRASHT